MKEYTIPNLPLPYDLETKAIMRQLNRANRKLAELKGVALTIPNESILLSTLTLQEARESSSVENIVTTQDDLFKEEVNIGGNGRTGKVKFPPMSAMTWVKKRDFYPRDLHHGYNRVIYAWPIEKDAWQFLGEWADNRRTSSKNKNANTKRI